MGGYFCSSGIRGVYGPNGFLSDDLAFKVGLAASEYTSAGKVIIGRDTRLSGPSLRKSLIKGLSDCHVVDLGVVPTPVLSHAVKAHSGDLGIMITASHNPAEYNGFKIWGSNGATISPSEEEKLEEIISGIKEDEIHMGVFPTMLIEMDYDPLFIHEIKNKVHLKGSLRVGIDCANGAACEISPRILQSYNYDVVPINCNFDGTFPGRDPEPNADTLKKTAELFVQERCNIGFAHDGDADRVVAIDEKGRVADFDKLLAFVSEQCYAQRTNGSNSIVTTVDASMALDRHLLKYPSLEIRRTKVGDVHVVSELIRSNSLFGGEPCGAYIFPEWSLAPDGIYAMLKILEFVEKSGQPLSEILDQIPKPYDSRTKIPCRPEDKISVIPGLLRHVPSECSINAIDGLLIKGISYMILIRPSGTENYIRMHAEAVDIQELQAIRDYWSEKIRMEVGGRALGEAAL